MSRQIEIPLSTKPMYNTDAVANAIASNDMMDVYLEPVPGIGSTGTMGFITRRRPGMSLFADVSTGLPGDGIFYWDAMNMVIAVSNGRVFNISQQGAATELSGTFNGSSGTPVVFADGQDVGGTPWLYMAANGLTYTTDGTTMVVPSDTNTPYATHVAWINGRFIANEAGTNRFDFTDVPPAGTDLVNDFWGSTDNPDTAEARGDKLSSLFTAFQEIYVWGTEGLEVWQDDGATPFSPIQGAFAEAGIEGPYAYGKIDNTIFALCVIEGKRVVIRMNARSPLIVSEPIARVLAEMKTVSDAFCDIISVGGISVALFSFPTDNQSWAYDYKNDTWLRWGYYNTETGTHDRFLGQHSCFAKTWNKHLIQSRIDGKIYELNRNVFNDYSNPLVSYRRSAWIDRGTWKRKRISQLFIKGKVYPKRGTQTDSEIITFNQGLNLLTNGGFDSDTTGWQAFDCTVDSVAGGKLGNCLEVTPTGGSYQYVYQTLTDLIVGKPYIFTAYVKSGTSGDEDFDIEVKDGPGNLLGITRGTSSSSWVQYTVPWIATATSVNVFFFKQSATSATMLFDSASVVFDPAGIHYPSILSLRWRDDGNPIWSTPMDISLNPDFQGDFVFPLNRMGTYRSRQYEFRLTDNVDMVLIGATEDVEVMRN